jgi:two-component system NtrC family sensor kinase
VSLSHLGEIELRLDLPCEGALKCAPPLLTQVLTNLLENAIYAAGTGGWVQIRTRAEAGQLTLELSDSGGGVPVALRERVFEPFFTTKPVGVGTGLGLPLARDIVHRHGGTLDIRERGGQTCFVVELPNYSVVDDAKAVGMMASPRLR